MARNGTLDTGPTLFEGITESFQVGTFLFLDQELTVLNVVG